MAHGAPGAVAAGHVYTFTHDASVSMRTVLVLARCAQQVLSDGIGGGAVSAHADFPVVSPASFAVTMPLANPGFDFVLFNNNGVSPGGASGLTPALAPIALFGGGADGVTAALYMMLASRNVAEAATITIPWAKVAVDGWTAIAATAQLGATNTASTLTFPQAVPIGGLGMAHEPGAFPRRGTRSNPALFGFGPRTGRHFG